MADLAKRIEKFLARRSLSPEAFARMARHRVSGRTVRRILDRELAMPQVRTWAILANAMNDPTLLPLRLRLLKARARRRAHGHGRSNSR